MEWAWGIVGARHRTGCAPPVHSVTGLAAADHPAGGTPADPPGGGPSPSVVPVPRARRVPAVAVRWAPTTPRARSSWRSGRRMPGSASMMSASAARMLLGPEGSGPTPRARRVVTEIIVGARTVAQATNDAAARCPSVSRGQDVRHDRALPDRRTLLAGPALPPGPCAPGTPGPAGRVAVPAPGHRVVRKLGAAQGTAANSGHVSSITR